MGSILQDTLHSQDGLNLGDIHFCPNMYALHAAPLPRWPAHPPRQGRIHAPSIRETPELGGMTAILLVFQADSRHEKITNIYVGLVVH